MDARDWDERYAGSELVWSAEPHERVARECADLDPGRAADLACGEGRHARWLAARGWTVTALDFSAIALDTAHRLAADDPGRDRITWEQADVTTWTGHGYDLVLLAYLQLREPERGRVVRAAFEALAPAGTLLLVAHDRTNLTEGTGGPTDPTVLMSAEDVLGDLVGHPARVRFADRVARQVVEPHGHRHEATPGRTAWDCLVRLERA